MFIENDKVELVNEVMFYPNGKYDCSMLYPIGLCGTIKYESEGKFGVVWEGDFPCIEVGPNNLKKVL